MLSFVALCSLCVPKSFNFRAMPRILSTMPSKMSVCLSVCLSHAGILNGRPTSFNDLEWPVTQISMSRHYSTSNNSKMVQELHRPTNRKLCTVYRKAQFSIDPVFKVAPFFGTEYLINGIRYGMSYFTMKYYNTFLYLRNVISNDVEWPYKIFNDAKPLCDSWASCFPVHHTVGLYIMTTNAKAGCRRAQLAYHWWPQQRQ